MVGWYSVELDHWEPSESFFIAILNTSVLFWYMFTSPWHEEKTRKGSVGLQAWSNLSTRHWLISRAGRYGHQSDQPLMKTNSESNSSLSMTTKWNRDHLSHNWGPPREPGTEKVDPGGPDLQWNASFQFTYIGIYTKALHINRCYWLSIVIYARPGFLTQIH